MLIDLPWTTVEQAMIGAARELIAYQTREEKKA
jgi:hypothetical protein